VAGVVEALGRGVTRFAPGDRVFGMPRFPREAAAYAEYVTSPSRQLARTPEGLSDVEAAALPLAGLTAWQALVETAAVGPGSRVLVLGAAGGVGHLAVQIAKSQGAYVLGTARAQKHDFLATLGADEAVDYTTGPLAGRVEDADVVVDLVGPEAAAGALPTLRDGGMLVTAASGSGLTPLVDAAAGRVTVVGILVEPDRAGLESLAALVADGALRPHVGGTFPLADAARAHERGELGRTQGKLVLTVA
jgi:NADPH:quinone reductase-like Zn-dependent oxidoreductase